MKLLKERCRERSICTMFFISSLTVSIKALFLSRIYSSGNFSYCYNFSDQLYAIKKEIFKQSQSDIFIICAWGSFDVFQELALFQRFTIIHISKCKHEDKNFTFIINNQVKFKTEESTHGTFSTLGMPFECFMNQNSLVTTDK